MKAGLYVLKDSGKEFNLDAREEEDDTDEDDEDDEEEEEEEQEEEQEAEQKKRKIDQHPQVGGRFEAVRAARPPHDMSRYLLILHDMRLICVDMATIWRAHIA